MRTFVKNKTVACFYLAILILASCNSSHKHQEFFGVQLDKRQGVVYQTMLNHDLNNLEVSHGYILVKNESEDVIKSDSIILFFNNNSFSFDSLKINRDTSYLVDFDVYRIFIDDQPLEVALNLKKRDEIVKVDYQSLINNSVQGAGSIPVHENGNVHDPRIPTNPFVSDGNTPDIPIKTKCGYLIGPDHIFSKDAIHKTNDLPEVMLYLNKTEIELEMDTVTKACFERKVKEVLGKRITIATNLVVVDDYGKCKH